MSFSLLTPREDSDALSKLQAVRIRYLKWKGEASDNQMHWYSAKELAAFARDSKLFADEIYQVIMGFSVSGHSLILVLPQCQLWVARAAAVREDDFDLAAFLTTCTRYIHLFVFPNSSLTYNQGGQGRRI